LNSDGSVVAWGNDAFGQTKVPTGITEVTAIAAGGEQSVALIGGAGVLSAKVRGAGFSIFWPVDLAGYTVQSTFSLKRPVIWVDSTNSPVTERGQFVENNPVVGTAQFFRLLKR
jgi:hypothetical protein